MHTDHASTLSTKDEVDLLLKEYDTVRREIDNKLNTFQLRSLPVVLVVLGALFGWKSTFDIEVIPLLVVPVAMVLISISTSSWFYIYRAGRWLAVIEDRVFAVTGRPLLTHETELLMQRQRRGPWKWAASGLVMLLAYILLESGLFWTLTPASRELMLREWMWVLLGLLLVVAPALRTFWDCRKIYALFAEPLSSTLGEHLKSVLPENKIALELAAGRPAHSRAISTGTAQPLIDSPRPREPRKVSRRGHEVPPVD